MDPTSLPEFRRRAGIGFFAAALLIILTGLVSFFALRVAISSDRRFSAQAREVIEYGRLRAATEIKMVSLRGYLISGDEKFLPELRRSRDDLVQGIRRIHEAAQTERERTLAGAIERAEANHQRAAEQAIALRSSGALEAVTAFFSENVEPAREALERSLSAFLLYEEQLLEETDRWSSGQVALASVLIPLSGLLALGLTIALSFTFTRRLTRLYEIERGERQAAEAAREKYRDLVEGIQGGIVWEADAASLRMKFVSRRAETMLGYPRRESSGDPDFWTNLIHPEDRERILATIARALSTGSEELTEHRCLAADGRIVWLQSRVHVVSESEGAPAVLRGLSVDITPLKQADEALRARASQQAAVARLGARALAERDLDRLFEDSVTTVAETVNAECVSVFELEPDGKHFRLRAGTGWSEGAVGRATVESGTHTQAGYTLLAGEPVLVENLFGDERFGGPSPLTEEGLVSGATIVIPGEGRPYGVLGAHRRAARGFRAEDVAFLQSVANVLSAAIGRKQAEKAVHESEARKGAVLASALDAIITIDYEGRILEFNPAAERIFGYPASSVIGREMAELIIPERLRDKHREGMARYLVRGEGPILNQRLEMPAIRSNGTEFPCELTIARISGEGPPVFTGFVRDITERKLAEAEKSVLLSSERAARLAAETAGQRAAFLAEASVTLASSLEYRTTLASVARLAVPSIADWCAVDMLEAEGELLRLATSYVDPSRIPPAEEINRRFPPNLKARYGPGHVVASGEPEVTEEITEEFLRAATRNEEHYQLTRELGLVSFMCVPLSVRGKVIGAISFASAESGRRFGQGDLVFAQDLARRAGVSIDNAGLYRDAREAIRARDEFLSIASHELKTPLTTLQLQVQAAARRLAAGGPLDLPRIASRLSTAERQVERLTSLINNLLDISRITAGRLELDLETVDLTAVVQDVLARSAEELSRAGCSLEIQSEGPSLGQWDRLRVEQIVINLVSNAVKYGAGQPIRVSVGGDGDTALLSVSDHGIGIAPEHQARIFERFERAVSDRHYGGLGLGLWIVRQILDALGGRIRVESAPGRGSSFTVELPRAARQSLGQEPDRVRGRPQA